MAIKQNGVEPDDLAVQTAEWIVRLSADDTEEREMARREFEAWKRADPAHASAAADLEQFVRQAQALGGKGENDEERPGTAARRRAARAALDAVVGQPPEQHRVGPNPASQARRLLAIMLVLILPVALALSVWPPKILLADLRTSTGKLRNETLSDGTQLTLSTATAVNVDFDRRQRHVKLLRGEILVNVARDASRPFTVETSHGRIRALGTRFIVRHDETFTDLTMLESRTVVRSAADRSAHPNETELTVAAGQSVRLTPAGIEPPRTVDAATVEDAFKSRRLVVRNQPLSSVLEELARHRRGVIRFDKEGMRDIHVTAVLPLDDTDRALQLLDDNFPKLRIRTLTPLMVLVDLN